jgi:hypothetical protein
MKKINKISNQNLTNNVAIINENDQNMSPQTKKTSEKNKESKPNPTRYGDWEMKGRCIDF